MLRDTLLRIAKELQGAQAQEFSGHPLAQFVRGQAAADVRLALGHLERGLTCKGSAGAGNWADVPWLAVFDPLVTSTATRGYYVVYLFNTRGLEVHLSLNQGTTAVRTEFGAQARTVLKDRAALIRARLADLLPTFKIYDLALGSTGTLPRDYEAGHAFGFPYQLDVLPDEQILRADLQALWEPTFLSHTAAV